MSYSLNGQAISAEELAGQSGRVTIRFDYTNNQYEYVAIDGENTKIYVPFIMLTGLVLDNDRFTNVNVTNGKLVNDGDRTLVAGFALPGLSDNLGLDGGDIDIPDYVEITADVTDFELETTVTYAANGLFDDLELDKISSLDGLSDSMTQLSDAMGQLMDGSSALYDGLSTLLDNSQELISGIDQLAEGAEQLAAGADGLGTGAAALETGIENLSEGLRELTSGNDSLTDGAKQVFETMLSTADSELAAAGVTADKLTIDNYASVLDGLGASLDKDDVYEMAYAQALETVTAAVRAQEAAVRAQVEAAVREEVTAAVISSALDISADEYDQAVSAGLISKEIQAQIDSAVEQQMQSETVQAEIDANTEDQIQKLIEEKMESDDVKAQIKAAVESATAGAGSLKALKAQLDSYNQFYEGLVSYTQGVKSAYDGSAQLANGSGQLAEGAGSLSAGAASLCGGLASLKSGGDALIDGVSQLKDGAMQLSDGLVQFNDEGMQKLLDAFDGDLGGLVDRFRATVVVSKSYDSFAGISDDMDGDVKFIYKTDSIEMPDEN